MKSLRLRRWFREGRLLLTPLDHGVTLGPIPGLVDLRQTVSDLVASDAVDAVVMHKGTLRALAPVLADAPKLAAVMHLHGSVGFGPRADRKVLTSTVEDALQLGADGVSVHINLGSAHDAEVLAELGHVGSACQRWGMPLLAMMYIRGDRVPDGLSAARATATRVAWELGADVVKLSYSGDREGFARAVSGVEIPVIAAGGPLREDAAAFLGDVRDALDAGAAGLAIGRNVFQRSERIRYVQALSRMVHEGAGVADVLPGLEA